MTERDEVEQGPAPVEQSPAPPPEPESVSPGETEPAAAAAPVGNVGDVGAAPGAAAPAVAGPPEIIVEIPGRRPGDAPLKLAVADEETAERLRQTVKSGLRRDELNKAMEAVNRDREALNLITQNLELDPVGFLVDHVKEEIQIDLTKHLLSLPHVFPVVSEDMREWSDPEALARDRAELARDRADYRERLVARFPPPPERPIPAEAPPPPKESRPARIVKVRRVS
jgi:hypothetical protein